MPSNSFLAAELLSPNPRPMDQIIREGFTAIDLELVAQALDQFFVNRLAQDDSSNQFFLLRKHSLLKKNYFAYRSAFSRERSTAR